MKSPFFSARLKLTTWYLLILMTVSMLFSAVIYQSIVSEVSRFDRMQRQRFERRIQEGIPLPSQLPPGVRVQFSVPPSAELVQEVQRRVLLVLITINSSILLIGGGLGYFLAGKTLRPIQVMMEEQERFVSDASHELRTPLTALLSSLEVYLRSPKHSVKEATNVIAQSVEEVHKLQKLSESLLQLTSSTSTLKNEFVNCSLATILADAVLAVRPLAEKKKISLSLPSTKFTVRGSQAALTEVIVILLENAVKYGNKDGQILVRVKKTSDSIVISVQDNGPGIAAADLPKIFDRFYRADSARSRKSGGYGLGLSIAKQIVAQHSGTLSVASKLGTGSTFTVSLPL